MKRGGRCSSDVVREEESAKRRSQLPPIRQLKAVGLFCAALLPLLPERCLGLGALVVGAGGLAVGSGASRLGGLPFPPVFPAGALEHWNNEKGCMVNVSQGDDVFGSNLGYNRLILVNAC